MEKLHPTAQVYITDKSGEKFFNTVCSAYHTDSEVKNMKYHLSNANHKPSLYDFLDIETAKIVVDSDLDKITDDELLAELGG